MSGIPGFRSGNEDHKTLAGSAYAVIAILVLGGILGGNPALAVLGIAVLACILWVADAWGIRSRVPLFRSSNQFVVATGWMVLVVVFLQAFSLATPAPTRPQVNQQSLSTGPADAPPSELEIIRERAASPNPVPAAPTAAPPTPTVAPTPPPSLSEDPVKASAIRKYLADSFGVFNFPWYQVLSSVTVKGSIAVATISLTAQEGGDFAALDVCENISSYVFSNLGRSAGLTRVQVHDRHGKMLVSRASAGSPCR